jgi:hypothetical protein
MLAEYAARRLDVATKYAHAAAATGQLAVSEDECRDVAKRSSDQPSTRTRLCQSAPSIVEKSS